MGSYNYDRSAARHYTPAEAVAINLLVDNPDITMADALRLVRESDVELWDAVSRTMVTPREVLRELEKFIPQPVSGGDIKVYHATDSSTARQFLQRGFLPETKPRTRTEDFDYAPGRGVDEGLYVGATPHQVESYGRAMLEIVVPRKFLEVPTELAQHGEMDALKALRNHDGAIINRRLPPDVFRLMP